MDILRLIKEKALLKKNKILMVDGEDERIIRAAERAVKEGICIPVILGEKDSIVKLASKSATDLNGIEIIDPHDPAKMERYIEELVQIRSRKGLTEEQAKELLKDPNYLGALLLKLGEVDGAVGGCKYSTAKWMRPVFQIVKAKEATSTVSAICFFVIDGKPYFFSDTDFNIKPSAKELSQIALNAAEFVNGTGIEPRVAFLSYSTKGSGEHESLKLIRDAVEYVHLKDKGLIVDGEIQFDAAVNPDAAAKKCPDCLLKGDANVLVFPDITVGNVLIHALNQWTDYDFYGSFPVGLSKPVMNGGRSFDWKQIYDVMTACAMRCNTK